MTIEEDRMDRAIKLLEDKLDELFREITDIYGYEVRNLYSYVFLDRKNGVTNGYSSINNLDIDTFDTIIQELSFVYKECVKAEIERINNEQDKVSIKDYSDLSLYDIDEK